MNIYRLAHKSDVGRAESVPQPKREKNEIGALVRLETIQYIIGGKGADSPSLREKKTRLEL